MPSSTARLQRNGNTTAEKRPAKMCEAKTNNPTLKSIADAVVSPLLTINEDRMGALTYSPLNVSRQNLPSFAPSIAQEFNCKIKTMRGQASEKSPNHRQRRCISRQRHHHTTALLPLLLQILLKGCRLQDASTLHQL